MAAAVLSLRWFLRHPSPVAGLPGGDPDEGVPDLRSAVASGSAALRRVDDARAAIIACYVAMEQSLARAGTARAAADAPDELLARAMAAGTVRAGPHPG